MSSVKFYPYRPVPGQELKAFYGACGHIDYLQETLYNLLKQKQELISYLKDKIKEQNHKLKILDFGLDIVHAKSKIMTYEEILSKIEKSDN